jgi:hypothetical protein
LFDKGKEILTDYGSARFVGVEQKYGGRYLPENKTYASQTIAHNTIVIDEKSHFNGNEDEGEKYHSDKLFSGITNSNVQVVSARENNAYKNASLQRTVYLLQLPGGKKIVVDIFNAIATDKVQFDLPFQYNGQLISTSFKYTPFTNTQETLGKKNGYQFLWKEAEAIVKDTLAQLTFMNNKTFYTISSMVEGEASLFLTRTGANDPSFNLRREPAFIIRKNGKEQVFVSVIEIHGNYDPVGEFSTNAYSAVRQIKLLENDEYTLTEIMINEKKLVITQCNKNFDKQTAHTAKGMNWTGPYAVWYDGKLIN